MSATNRIPVKMGELDPGFVFSQHSLADYDACARRFYLRFIARQAWPMVEDGPEGLSAIDRQAYLRQGKTLHRWIERRLLGLPAGADSTESADAELVVWWERFLATDLSGLPARRTPELELACVVGGARLYARFDLLASDEDGRAVIVDWKTLRGQKPPSPAFFRDRLQTRVYLFALAAAGAPFNGGRPFDPARLSMRYWLANFPERPWVDVPYSRADYEVDGQRLTAMVSAIRARSGEAAFEKTERLQTCAMCDYRTLCARGSARGGVALEDAAIALDDAALLDDTDAPALEY
ncbi:MAG TPA: PD-(D/E)XK nuclease family protein [Thermoflexales bacterium]|nr:PD-(D/E)XK nuclease family protein [Thermoflexales bacterium]